MTDITELMQRLKETASKATQGEWQVYGKPVSTNFDAMYIFSRLIQGTVGEQDALYMLSADGLCPALTGTGPNSKNNAEFIAQANPANILALVEALEMARRYIEELREWNAGLAQESCECQQRIVELENQLKAAENNEIDARCRIAELEESHAQVIHSRDHYKALWRESLKGARTVTVKLPSLNPEMFNGDVMFGYHKAQKEAVEFCAAAGIKVEVE